MDKTIRQHLDAIADQLKGTKTSFLFLMTERNDKQHIVKNCLDHNAAALMLNYIESTPEVHDAFTSYVMNLQTSENTPELTDESMVPITNDWNEAMWGEELFNAFADNLTADGWLTKDWAQIIEDNYDDVDKDYNENKVKKNIYTRMYMMDFEESDCGQFIKPKA